MDRIFARLRNYDVSSGLGLNINVIRLSLTINISFYTFQVCIFRLRLRIRSELPPPNRRSIYNTHRRPNNRTRVRQHQPTSIHTVFAALFRAYDSVPSGRCRDADEDRSYYPVRTYAPLLICISCHFCGAFLGNTYLTSI